MKKVTQKWLTSHNACEEAVKWGKENNLIGSSAEIVIKEIMAIPQFDWANWLIVRLMNKKQKVMYAIFAAEQVIDIYEKKYPDDKRPRKAIEAAKAHLKNPSKKTKTTTVVAAANAAYAAARAAYGAYAVYAAAAYGAAAAAAYGAAAVAYGAYAYGAARAADANTHTGLKIKIINYGLSLIK